MTEPLAWAADPAVEQTQSSLAEFLSGVIEPALTLAAAIGLVWGIYGGVRAFWRRTWGSRRDLTRRIDKLGIGLSGDYVEELFGKPLLRSAGDDGETRTFLPRHAWVSVSLQGDGSVAAFSVTTVDPRFNYSTAKQTFGLIPIRVGRSTFEEAMTIARGSAGEELIIGAHRCDYRQRHYLANLGAYLSVIFLNTETGRESNRRRHRAHRDNPVQLSPSGLPSTWPKPGFWATGRFRGSDPEAAGIDGGADGDDRTWLTAWREDTVITGFTVTSDNTSPETHHLWVRRIHPGDRYYQSLGAKMRGWWWRRASDRRIRKLLSQAAAGPTGHGI